MAARYVIVDEPSPSGIAHLAVRPMWILLSGMLAGSWLAYPWFFVNAWAIGSVTKWRELAWLVAGVVGTGALLFILVALTYAGKLPAGLLPYAKGLLPVYKLIILYFVFQSQNRSFQLHEHFGGLVRSGLGVLIAGTLAKPYVLQSLKSPILQWLAH